MPTDHSNSNDSQSLTHPLLTYEEAAELLGLKLGTLYSLVSTRRIPHVRLSGRLVRFERSTLEEYIAERRVNSH